MTWHAVDIIIYNILYNGYACSPTARYIVLIILMDSNVAVSHDNQGILWWGNGSIFKDNSIRKYCISCTGINYSYWDKYIPFLPWNCWGWSSWCDHAQPTQNNTTVILIVAICTLHITAQWPQLIPQSTISNKQQQATSNKQQATVR